MGNFKKNPAALSPETHIERIDVTDHVLINRIAMWYLSEWFIPKERTIQRLQQQSPGHVPFYLVLKKNNVPVAVAGLSHDVGLVTLHPEYRKYGPWITMLYTIQEERNKGYGTLLMKKIESMAAGLNIHTLYLYTSTAEEMYLKQNWKQVERITYRDAENVIMVKAAKS